MNRKITPAIAIAAVLVLTLSHASSARGQVIPPIFGGPVTAFDTEISVLNSGALLDAQAVVSHDQRYVTTTVRASNSTLLGLQQFQTQRIATGRQGFVGGATPAGVTAQPAGSAAAAKVVSPPASDSILNRRGIFLMSPPK